MRCGTVVHSGDIDLFGLLDGVGINYALNRIQSFFLRQEFKDMMKKKDMELVGGQEMSNAVIKEVGCCVVILMFFSFVCYGTESKFIEKISRSTILKSILVLAQAVIMEPFLQVSNIRMFFELSRQ